MGSFCSFVTVLHTPTKLRRVGVTIIQGASKASASVIPKLLWNSLSQAVEKMGSLTQPRCNEANPDKELIINVELENSFLYYLEGLCGKAEYYYILQYSQHLVRFL